MVMEDCIHLITDEALCIGCGFCAAVCPRGAITMRWTAERTWRPEIDPDACTHCGACLAVCPNAPARICEYARAARRAGARFGLPPSADFFVGYDLNADDRVCSASGGVITALLRHLLASGEIDGVIGSVPLKARSGKPHFEIRLLRTDEQLDGARSSHYHPQCYADALQEAGESGGRFALVGVPCVIRAAARLPDALAECIRYRIAVACGRGATGAHIDCLARREGVALDEPFSVNLRDKTGIPDAGSYNNCFYAPDREIRRSRFETAHTDMWRGFFFTPKICFHCPDFYGAEADLSVKDAWGRLARDPLGISMLVCRNAELTDALTELKRAGRIHLGRTDAGEVFRSQVVTGINKHVDVWDRILWEPILRRELRKAGKRGTARRWWAKASHEFFRLRRQARASSKAFRETGEVNVKRILRRGSVCAGLWTALRWAVSPFVRVLRTLGRMFGCIPPLRPRPRNELNVLITGGYGYGNVGDEAQLAANLAHFRQLAPHARLTVLTADVRYTERVHAVHAEPAPRNVFFKANDTPHYRRSDGWFRLRYRLLSPLLRFNAALIRAGLPTVGLSAEKARLLDAIYRSDLLFFSGGGYLTGRTASRLWEGMLLIRLADAMGVPTILSGQTIGLFTDAADRRLARRGLSRAELITLRDSHDSPAALESIGIDMAKVEVTFDDALFCPAADDREVERMLAVAGVDPEKPYMAVNVHRWGQSAEITGEVMGRMAATLDTAAEDLGVQIAFVPMHTSDEDAIRDVAGRMKAASAMVEHGYAAGMAIGAIRRAAICLTMKHHPIVFAMGGSVPTVAVALDAYYRHKNEGALRLFGQEEFMVSAEVDRLGETVGEKLRCAWRERERIRGGILATLAELRPRGGEVIRRWLAGRALH